LAKQASTFWDCAPVACGDDELRRDDTYLRGFAVLLSEVVVEEETGALVGDEATVVELVVIAAAEVVCFSVAVPVRRGDWVVFPVIVAVAG
jgi:hypothetical protein